MQCLYCEAELKAFRGLFDEDFCCREHRDKYIASFRKSLTRLPAEPADEEGASATRLADFRQIDIRPVPVPAVHKHVLVKPFMAPSVIEISSSKPSNRDPFAPEERPAGLVELAHSALRAFVALPLNMPPSPPVASRFSASDDGSALLPTIEFFEPALQCRQFACSPVASAQLALGNPVEIPGFQASQAAMQTELEIESTPDLTGESGAALKTAVGAGPASVASPAPVNCPLPVAAASSQSPAGLASQPAQINVPGLAAGAAAQPGVAPEMVSGISHEHAANPTAAPHTHGALQPSFWNSVRIKKWRLRITFAKPA